MKHLFIMRHAKSSWDDASLSDHDRTLNKRGIQDAPEMGQRLAKRGINPDLIVSSSAMRAHTTARIIAGEIAYDEKNININNKLYGASPYSWMQVIHELDDKLECVMIFGHNPAITEVAMDLTGEYIANVPTCGVVDVVYKTKKWSSIGKIKLFEFNFDYPKNLSH